MPPSCTYLAIAQACQHCDKNSEDTQSNAEPDGMVWRAGVSMDQCVDIAAMQECVHIKSCIVHNTLGEFKTLLHRNVNAILLQATHTDDHLFYC